MIRLGDSTGSASVALSAPDDNNALVYSDNPFVADRRLSEIEIRLPWSTSLIYVDLFLFEVKLKSPRLLLQCTSPFSLTKVSL
jgi:hypothetical protein